MYIEFQKVNQYIYKYNIIPLIAQTWVLAQCISYSKQLWLCPSCLRTRPNDIVDGPWSNLSAQSIVWASHYNILSSPNIILSVNSKLPRKWIHHHMFYNAQTDVLEHCWFDLTITWFMNIAIGFIVNENYICHAQIEVPALEINMSLCYHLIKFEFEQY